MPEEAWVLKCYSCNKFQVQLKKKAKKWQCKVCGKKQDLMTIFFKGQPKDCRTNVQKLNIIEGKKHEKLEEHKSLAQDYDHDPPEPMLQDSCSDFFNDENELFTEEAMLEIEHECKEVEKSYSQKNSNSLDKFLEVENTGIQRAFTDTTQKIIQKDPLKLKDNCSNNLKSQETKLSIFESNSDFDESFDF